MNNQVVSFLTKEKDPVSNFIKIKKHMNIKQIILVSLFVLIGIKIQAELIPSKRSLAGVITDKTTNQPILNASIYFPDLQRGTTTNENGMYQIADLPNTQVTIQITNVGYQSVNMRINLVEIKVLNIALTPTIIELNELVITGQSGNVEKRKTAAPIHVISPIMLQQTTSTNIINAIAKQPGLSEITTGGGISKPIIRGLGYNRVVVLNDGVRQEGQQWGDEHGVEIDEYSVTKVEILKGPASLVYGSDAMAGVIHLISTPIIPDSTIKGQISMNYQSNNGLWGGSAYVNGNTHGFVWGGQYSYKKAHDYSNKYDGSVYNSRFSEDAFNVHLGINKSWGFSNLKFSSYHLTPGIVEGERDSLTGKFIKPFVENDSTASSEIVSSNDAKSYTMQTPHQNIQHNKLIWNNLFLIRKYTLKTTFGWQQNKRKEFADIFEKEMYQLYFLLNTFTYNLQLDLPENKWVDVSIGANGMKQISENKGVEFLVPAYQLFDFGMYAIGKKSIGSWTISGGFRLDHRTIDSKSLFLNSSEEVVSETDADANPKFNGFLLKFEGFSGSLGVTYPLWKNVHSKINLSQGFRAPNIAELGANGIHEGTIRYEQGNIQLKAENSTQIDVGFSLDYSHFSFEINGFYNQIKNYIYLEKQQNSTGPDSIIEGNSLFRYTSGNAQLYGGEIAVDFHPKRAEWIHFENSFSWVIATQKNRPDSATYLPFTPASKWMSTLRITKKESGSYFRKLFANVELEYYFKKDNVYSINNTETPTPDYGLINLNAGLDLNFSKKWSVTLVASINNLLDVAYQSHLSRLKYAPENYASGRFGVFNMGRNVSVKLIIPINIR